MLTNNFYRRMKADIWKKSQQKHGLVNDSLMHCYITLHKIFQDWENIVTVLYSEASELLHELLKGNAHFLCSS